MFSTQTVINLNRMQTLDYLKTRIENMMYLKAKIAQIIFSNSISMRLFRVFIC